MDVGFALWFLLAVLLAYAGVALLLYSATLAHPAARPQPSPSSSYTTTTLQLRVAL